MVPGLKLLDSEISRIQLHVHTNDSVCEVYGLTKRMKYM